MNPIARSWKVNLPRPLSTASRPILKRVNEKNEETDKKEEKDKKETEEKDKKETEEKDKKEIEEKDKKENEKIDIILQIESEYFESDNEYNKWSALLFSVIHNKGNDENDLDINEKIIHHLRSIPRFYREMGMFTLSLDLVISRIEMEIKNIKIEEHYRSVFSMIDNIFLDDVAGWPGSVLLFLGKGVDKEDECIEM